MNTLRALAAATTSLASLLAADVAMARNGHMMNYDTWGHGWTGGYVGIGMLILLVAVAGLIAWIVKSRTK
jgi:hypothetical protein